MEFPDDVKTVTLTFGPYFKDSNEGLDTSYHIKLPNYLVHAETDTIIFPESLVIDVFGAETCLELPATDNTTLNLQNFQYEIFNRRTGKTTFISLPASKPVVDFDHPNSDPEPSPSGNSFIDFNDRDENRQRASDIISILPPIKNYSPPLNLSGFFETLVSLKEAPYLDLVGVEDISSLFSGCEHLKSVPNYDYSTVDNAAAAFSNTGITGNINLRNTNNITNASQMFVGCKNLASVHMDTSSIVDASDMFVECVSLTDQSIYNVNSVISLQNTFEGCSLLESVVLSIPNCMSISGIVSRASSLKTLILRNCENVTQGEIFFDPDDPLPLETLELHGLSQLNTYDLIRPAVCFKNLQLSAENLDAFFESLGEFSGGSGQYDNVLLISGNPGALTCNASIAEDKGWVVLRTDPN